MLSDIQRRRSRRSLPSRPQPLVFAQNNQLGQIDPVWIGEIKAQPVRMADVFVFGPMMIYTALGRKSPPWLRVGMLILGVGTIAYNLYNYFEVERRKVADGVLVDPDQLGQMQHGPMHKATDLHRPIQLLRGLAPR